MQPCKIFPLLSLIYQQKIHMCTLQLEKSNRTIMHHSASIYDSSLQALDVMLLNFPLTCGSHPSAWRGSPTWKMRVNNNKEEDIAWRPKPNHLFQWCPFKQTCQHSQREQNVDKREQVQVQHLRSTNYSLDHCLMRLTS